MNITILKQEKQPLLSRIEISAKVSFIGATPSKEELKKNISSKLKQKEELTEIKHIYNEFGSQEAEVEAFIYEDKKVMNVLEKSKKKKEEKPKEEAPATEKPTEKQKEQSEEKPKEEAPATEKPTEKQEEQQKEQSEEKPKEEAPATEKPTEKQEESTKE